MRTGTSNHASHFPRCAPFLPFVLGFSVLFLLTACEEATDGKKGLPAGYTPTVGDVIFQSSAHNRLVDMIEGVSESPYSHCGIVGQEGDDWVVYEAGKTVKATPLKKFLERGRDQGFAVYQFKEGYRDDIPDIIENTRSFLDRPYDFRYRWDDEHIYCSELIYKAFEQTTGEPLGQLAKLGDLNWEPFEKDIKHFEDGPVPMEREIITPQDLADAEQLVRVLSHNLDTADE